MLLSLEEINPILICPKCASPVVAHGQQFICANSECSCGGGTGFLRINNQPVLVDFETSILEKDEVLTSGGMSVVIRKNNILRSFTKDRVLRSDAVNVAQRNAVAVAAEIESIGRKPIILIVGGGTRGIATDLFFDDKNIGVVSFDIYASENTQFLADGHHIPLADCSVDAVWIQYVLEHVLSPWQVVAEIHRVLRDDGLVYSETPFMQQVHEGPYDFTRFTHSGHRWLFRQFEEIDSGISMGMGVQQMWSAEHLVRGIFRSERAGQGAKLAVALLLRMLERLIPRPYRYDSASSFYFLGRKSPTHISQIEMVGYYRGAKRVV